MFLKVYQLVRLLVTPFFFFLNQKQKHIHKNTRLKEKDEKSFAKLKNLIKTEEKKNPPIDIKMTRYCYFNTFDLHIEILSN